MRIQLSIFRGWYRVVTDTLIGWVVLAFVLSTAALLQVASRNDLHGMHEAGDSAGDALQARLGLSRLWFPTGHHTDVGVPHPGPFALWVKAAAELLAPATGLTVLGTTLLLFTVLKVVFTVIGAAAVASFTRKPAAGLVFCAVVYSGGWITMSDPVAVGLQSLPIWPIVALVPAAMAVARGEMRFLPLTLFVAGATMHIHTVSAPAGALVFGYATWKLIRTRHDRNRLWWFSSLITGVFAVPLIVRVFTELGWPLSYRTAIVNRTESLQSGAVDRVRFGLLADRLDVSPAVVFPTLVAAFVSALVIAVASRRWREAMVPVLVVSGWAAVVAWISPPDQQFGTELYWITGWWASMAGLVASAIVVVVLRLVPRSITAGAGAGALLVAVFAVAVAVPPVFNQKISGTVGVDGTYVPTVVDTIVERADGRVVAVGLDMRWLEVEMGVLLELDRRDIPHCLTYTMPFPVEQIPLFFTEDRLCGPLSGDELLVGSVRDPSERLNEVWYTQEFRDDLGARHPYFSFGIPACAPQNAEGLPYPRCSREAAAPVGN